MANKVSVRALHFSRSGVGSDKECASLRGARPEGPGFPRLFGESAHETQNEGPTLVPFNSPVVTPSQSLARASCKSATGGGTFADLATDSGVTIDSFSTSASFFNVSLVSDNSEEDNESERSLDALFCSSPVPQRSSVPASARGCGLGISGVNKKDGTTPFDGTGIVSSSWRRPRPSHTRDHARHSFDEFSRRPSASGYEADGYALVSEDSSGTLSRVFLQEAFMTFTEDPFHTCVLEVIPECRSWYELEGVASRKPSPVHFDPSLAREPASPVVSQAIREANTVRLKKTFSSPTISSELKRSASVSGKRTLSTRPSVASVSSSPPSLTGRGTRAASDLGSMKGSPRREWRL
ncbi:hypothetical protein M413DRAFT_10149 [Hebeloma cylindrosporum]|uniref:Uncharacterized protein n=1 Tax=Hebeloma cylindrosporum TaxID=76867 RepID=A0A0C2YNP8_HEBCY|nr:hypothetical protein M413DRAFT_10149 [Hebeloma cylindrosporum h7]